MRSFILNKLVKDKVFTNMQELGQQITYHKLTDEEFLPELKKKLLEEAQEFDVADKDAVNELADLLEVIEQIAKEIGKDFDEVRKAQIKRKQVRGGFDNKIYIERVGLDDDDPWVKYYASEPERFPEVSDKI